MRLVLVLLVVSSVHPALAQEESSGCLAPTKDQITGGDLRHISGFENIPEDAVLGFSPVPGVKRVFRVDELRRFAVHYGLQPSIGEPLCFAWPMRSLSGAEIRSAIAQTLTGKAADIRVKTFSHAPAPAGELVFPKEGLTAHNSKSTVWNGYVRYGKNQKFNVWSEIDLTVKSVRVVAVHAIHEGQVLGPGDIRQEAYSGPLPNAEPIEAPSEAVGKAARQPLAEGAVLLKTMLTAPIEVEQNQIVSVHVVCGAAHIDTQGIAAASGRAGDIIGVRNLKTGRLFSARVDQPGEVTVVRAAPGGLVVEDKKI